MSAGDNLRAEEAISLIGKISAVKQAKKEGKITEEQYNGKMREHLYSIMLKFRALEWKPQRVNNLRTVSVPTTMDNPYFDLIFLYGKEIEEEIVNFIFTELVKLITRESDRVFEVLAVKYNGTYNEVFKKKTPEAKAPEKKLRHFIGLNIWKYLYHKIPDIYKENGNEIFKTRLEASYE